MEASTMKNIITINNQGITIRGSDVKDRLHIGKNIQDKRSSYTVNKSAEGNYYGVCVTSDEWPEDMLFGFLSAWKDAHESSDMDATSVSENKELSAQR